MSMHRVLPVSFVAFVLGCSLAAAQAQTKAFNETFTGASTVNANPTSPAAPTVTAASYQQLAAKSFNPNPPAITEGNMRFGIVATSSGFNHIQALFTQYPVTLVNTGDSIELTVSFSTEGGIITPQTNSTLFFGLYNAGQVQPIPGGMNGTSATATAGYAQTWQGYVNRIFYAGGNNGFYARPVQTEGAANNQDVLYNFPGATAVGATATSALAAFVSGDQYTEVFRITKASDTTLTLESSLYAGATATGTPLYAQSSTSSSILTDVFDAFAIGWRATGSVVSIMNVSSVKITTTGTTTIIPEILTQPFSLTKMVGESVQLTVVADGGAGTALTYQWTKDGVDLPGATSSTYEIASAALSDAGDYGVVVADVAGSTTSTTATLTVTTGPVPPSIVTDPTGAMILVGGSHTFDVTANGTATLTYQWEHSVDDGANYVEIAGATGTSLSITDATLADAGLYRVLVTNGQGTATSAAAELAIQQAPVITAQPVGATLSPGASLVLSVTATGTPAPGYQWRRNGLAIAGATSSTYTINAAIGADTGNYTVVVSNIVGAVTSSPASVAVVSPSMATTALTPDNAATGLNPDTRLSITFNEAVTPGVSGYLRIHDAANDSVVDTIDLVAATTLRDTLRATSTISTQLLPVQSKPIGGIATNFNYYPITIAGSTATIHLRNGVLARGRTYYVTIDPGVFVNASGESFAGIADSTTWVFSTRASGPAAGATSLTVAADGSGDFDTLQAALDFIPAGNTTPTTIFLRSGTYFEEIGLQAKHFITILGEDADETIIAYPNNNTFNNVSGVYHRATMVAQSVHDFTLANLTIQNTTPQNGSQAEAIVINGSSATAGRNMVTGCKFYSYQDTVQFNKQTYISDTTIHGDVDFMWGDGPSYFENCDIRILRTAGYFTQIRNGSGNHGYVFRNCRFTAPAGINGTFFGRIDPAVFPYSEVVVLDSTVGDATNNAVLATATGVSGSSYAAGWWLLNNAATPAAAGNMRYWSNSLVDGMGAALINPNGDAFATMPLDATTQANYRDPFWVLNTSIAGAVNGSWTPTLAPVIAAQPLSQSIAIGQPATFAVAVAAVPAATFQWSKDGVEIVGATAASYVIASATTDDVGAYTVVATNSAGTATSDAATLSVDGVLVAPTITTHPEGDSVVVGASVSFSVTATGSAPLTYQWHRDGLEIIGATEATYMIASAGLGDAGSYTVVVSNGAGSDTSSAAILEVTIPAGGTVVDDTFADGNSSNEDFATGSLRLFNGRSANTRIDAVGSVAFTIASTSADGFWAHFTEAGSPLTLAVGDRLAAEMTFSLNGFVGTGQDVRFGVFNSAGTRNTVNLTGGMNSSIFADDLAYGVRYIASGSSSPFTLIKRNPVGSTANPNNPFNTTGTSDWSVVNTALSGTNAVASLANATPYTITYEIYRESESSTVVSAAVFGGDLPAGYGQIATDTAATLTAFDHFGFRIGGSSFATGVTFTRLNVAIERAEPEIVAEPTFSNGLNAISLPVSGSTVLSVGATGAGLVYQWFKDDEPISGATSASIEFFNVQLGDSGVYSVVVVNAGGSVSSAAATLTVTGGPVAPTIVLDPESQTIAEGGSGTLSVVAIGTTPFSYQWYHGAMQITGATDPEFTITNAAPGDAGDYSVVVTNVAGQATSAVAAIQVKGVAAIVPSGFATGVTGGAAGPTVTVASAGDLKIYAESTAPYTIIIAGTIDLGLSGRVKLGSNKTLRGATTSSTLLGSITISSADNVIVSNLNISANTGAPSTNDGVTISSSTNVLVTKCTIYDCTDGNLDINNGSDLVTVSWCKFYYTRDNGHNFSNLVGSADDDVGSGDGLTNYRVTWRNNWWSTGAKQRMIACRFGQAHMFNNYWDCAGNDYCTESRNIASVFSEQNVYDGVSNPLAKRTALPTDAGLLLTIGNVFENCTGRQAVSSDLLFTPPYSYVLDATDVVAARVKAGAGNTIEDTPVGSTAAISGSAPTATVGSGYALTAMPAGFTPVSWQWRLNNFAITGATGATLELPSAQVTDAGTYTVVVGLADGDAVVSAPFTLAVEAAPVPPTITTQPLSQTATVGDTVTFLVVAAGDEPLSYQWRKDGEDIPSATAATLELVSVITANAGDYDCVVSNPAGSTESAVATLVIQKAAATVTVHSATVTYDGTAKSVLVTTAPAGLPVSVLYGGSPAEPVSAGSYAVDANIVHADYSGGGSGLLVIEPASATISFSGLAQIYDGAQKMVTTTTSPAGLSVAITYDDSATAPTNAGSYAVVASIADANFTGSASDTLVIAKATATITLDGLTQRYDGTPRLVTATTDPAGLVVDIVYGEDSTAPVYPGSYDVTAVVDDPNHEGATMDTLVIGTTLLVRHAPALAGDIDGSLQVLLPESVTLGGSASVAGDLLVPGTPTLRLKGHPIFVGTIDGPGAETPTNHVITLNSGSALQHLVRRIDAVAMPAVATPPAPSGWRDAVLISRYGSVGDFDTLRHLTLIGNIGTIAVPPGTYGVFTAIGRSTLVLGVAGSTTPAIYNLKSLALSSGAQVRIVGPVILTLADGAYLNGSVNAHGEPGWLLLRVGQGSVLLEGDIDFAGDMLAPSGSVMLTGRVTFTGTITADRLSLGKDVLVREPAP